MKLAAPFLHAYVQVMSFQLRQGVSFQFFRGFFNICSKYFHAWCFELIRFLFGHLLGTLPSFTGARAANLTGLTLPLLGQKLAANFLVVVVYGVVRIISHDALGGALQQLLFSCLPHFHTSILLRLYYTVLYYTSILP